MRLDYAAAMPEALTARLGLEKAVHDSNLEPKLAELVKMRASQINGVRPLLGDAHKDARALGEERVAPKTRLTPSIQVGRCQAGVKDSDSWRTPRLATKGSDT